MIYIRRNKRIATT